MLLNYIEDNFKFLIIYGINFLFIFYFKLDSDSKNFLFNFLNYNINKIEIVRDLHNFYLSEKKRANLKKKK